MSFTVSERFIIPSVLFLMSGKGGAEGCCGEVAEFAGPSDFWRGRSTFRPGVESLVFSAEGLALAAFCLLGFGSAMLTMSVRDLSWVLFAPSTAARASSCNRAVSFALQNRALAYLGGESHKPVAFVSTLLWPRRQTDLLYSPIRLE